MNREVNQYSRQLDCIRRKERKLMRPASGAGGEKSGLMAKIEAKIPDKLIESLDTAFFLAFQVLFQEGTKVLGKTIPEKKLRAERYIKEYNLQQRPGKEGVQAFHRGAVISGGLTTVAATAEGCVLGLAGMGIPDIPILLSILLRAVYQTALRYGFDYSRPEERYYILLVLCAALTRGSVQADYSRRADAFGRATDARQPPWFDLETQMRETSKTLASALLVVKFIQGTAIVGVVGGMSNFSTSRRVTAMANLKYQKRFFEKKRDKA